MNQEFSDELISAYLDGELTAEEQARVEELLMDSRDHRRVFEELRTLRNTLQSMPSYTLDDRFADRVLRRAEDAMLTESTDADDKSSTVGSDGYQSAKSSSPTAQQGSWRTAVFAVASVAALLLVSIMLIPRGTDHSVNVARQTLDEATQDTVASEDPHALSSASEMQEGVADAASVAETFDRDLDRKGMQIDSIERLSRKSDSVPSATEANRASRMDRLGGRFVEQPIEAKEESAATSGKRAELSAARPDHQSTSKFHFSPSFASKEPNARGFESNKPYVVHVSSTNVAFNRQAFDDTLSRNGIRLSTANASAQIGQRLNQLRELTDSVSKPSFRASAKDQSKTTPGDLDVVIVEATPLQIEAMCSDLSRNKNLLTMTMAREANQYFSMLQSGDQEPAGGEKGQSSASLGKEAAPAKGPLSQENLAEKKFMAEKPSDPVDQPQPSASPRSGVKSRVAPSSAPARRLSANSNKGSTKMADRLKMNLSTAATDDESGTFGDKETQSRNEDKRALRGSAVESRDRETSKREREEDAEDDEPSNMGVAYRVPQAQIEYFRGLTVGRSAQLAPSNRERRANLKNGQQRIQLDGRLREELARSPVAGAVLSKKKLPAEAARGNVRVVFLIQSAGLQAGEAASSAKTKDQ